MRRRPLAAAVALALSTLVAPAANANGAFPASSQLIAEPSNPDHMVLRTTFGLLVTRDRGASWDWLCEAGMGYENVQPPMAVLPGGVVLLAVPDGVSRGDPTGCDFVLSAGITGTVYDLAREPSDPKRALAIGADGADAQLWRTKDAGLSFVAVGDVLPGFIPATVDVAASNPDVIYASGLSGTSGALLRSSDGGQSFERFPVPTATAARRPFIAAVDPRDENTVYVRLDAQGSSPLEVTHDGGRSFVTPLTTTVSALGFALSPDGQTVLASNGYDGTFRASASTLDFHKVACSGPTCLSFNDAGLFGCGDQQQDGFIVGRSDDLGASFQRVVDLTCVRGPLACDSGTSIGEACPAAWPYVQAQIGATQCAPPSVAPDDSCLPDGGAAGDSGASGAAGAPGDTAGGGGRPEPNGEPGVTHTTGRAESGCGCRLGRSGSRTSTALLAGLALASAAAKRRRRARRR